MDDARRQLKAQAEECVRQFNQRIAERLVDAEGRYQELARVSKEASQAIGEMADAALGRAYR